jgi:hypothetical protein
MACHHCHWDVYDTGIGVRACGRTGRTWPSNVDFHRFDEVFTSGTPPVCVAGPTSKQQCKKGGWRQFRNPSFKTQGQWVKFVNHQGEAGKPKGHEEKGNSKKKGGKNR